MKNNNTLLRKANKDDILIIFELIIQEAKEGHFDNGYVNEQSHPGLMLQLLMTINENLMPISDSEKLKSELYVLALSNNIIGFTWLRYHNHNNLLVCERYLSAIVKSERNKGYGKTLFNETQAKINTKKTYVDLLPKSYIMKKILLNHGFKITGYNNGGMERVEYSIS